MQKVLTAEQMRGVDRLTTERYGIPSILLMENAAHAVARVITEKLGGSVEGKSILILCGPGNNGGDGAALARILWQQKATVSVALIGTTESTKDDARIQFDTLRRLADAGTPFVDYSEFPDGDLQPIKASLDRLGIDLIVDAMFGTGFNRPLDQPFQMAAATAAQWSIDMRRVPMLSIDLPSGLNADYANPIGSNVKADWTVTFTSPKLANVLPPVSRLGGELIVEQIGSPEELVDQQPSQLYLAEGQDAALWLARSEFTNGSYKNKRGHALVIAGSENYTGAAVMCGNAAIRSGVGLVTIATPKSSKDSIAARILPEVMVRGVAETESGSIDDTAFDELHDLLEKADSVAVGSGISQDESTKNFVQRVIENRRQPTIVDADALNLMSPFRIPQSAIRNPQSGGPPEGGTPSLILTPHEGEFMRLLGTDDKDAIKDRVAAVRDFATTHNVILVLKGERVLIGEPGGKVVVNPTGNSGLGKAGNGDTLAGILAGFVAQASAIKIDIFETVVAAVYVAGMAGDIAERKYGKRVMTASDVRECLTETFERLAAN